MEVQHRAPVGRGSMEPITGRADCCAGTKDDPSKESHGIQHTAFEYAPLPELLDSFDRLRGLGTCHRRAWITG
jgi:hypothetical protein